ncbi:MAG: haloacid dehalogenase-like hydrolase [Elusimicrobia bacterium]|nr:haloacid dehalogenase-like hydrolase [Elusimicrobiota bacterium]
MNNVLLSVLITTLSATACRAAAVPSPVDDASELEAGIAKQLPRLARMTFHPSFELFEDAGKPWPQDKALGALWVHEVDDRLRVDGAAYEPGGTLLVSERGEDHYRHRIQRLSSSGTALSSFTVSGYYESILAGDLGGKPSLVTQDMYQVQVLDRDGTPRWKDSRPMESAVLCDLDGDGKGELVGAVARYKNLVQALSADGRLRWEAALPADSLLNVAAASLGGKEGTLVAAFSARRGRATVFILDGNGRTVLDYPDDTSPELGALGRLPDGSPFIATVGSRWQSGHSRLRISRLSGRTKKLEAESDLGPIHAVSMALADLDADRSPEVLLGTDNGWVMVFDLKARRLSQRHFFGSIPSLAAGGLEPDGSQWAYAAVRGVTSRVYGIRLHPGLGILKALPVAAPSAGTEPPKSPAWSKEIDGALEAFLEKGPDGPAVFEAEGTLWAGDAGDAFLRWLAAEGMLPKPRDGKEPLARYDALLSRDRRKAKELAATLLAGMKEAEVRGLAGRFFSQRFYGRIYRPVTDLVARLRATGRPVWIASDSPRWIVEAGIEFLEIEPERVAAMDLVVQDGVLTAKLKKPAVKKALGRRPSLVVGGSEDGDALLRSSSGRALLITHGRADPGLLKTARKKGWLVQDFP